MNYLKICSVFKQIIVADRDGNWALHVGSIENSTGILREFHAISYLRCASLVSGENQGIENSTSHIAQQILHGTYRCKGSTGSSNFCCGRRYEVLNIYEPVLKGSRWRCSRRNDWRCCYCGLSFGLLFN